MSSDELSNSFLTTSLGNVIEQLPLRHRRAMSSNELYGELKCAANDELFGDSARGQQAS